MTQIDNENNSNVPSFRLSPAIITTYTVAGTAQADIDGRKSFSRLAFTFVLCGTAARAVRESLRFAVWGYLDISYIDNIADKVEPINTSVQLRIQKFNGD